MAPPSPGRRGRGAPTAQRARVLRVERLTPHMIRVVFGGDGLSGFDAGEFSDHYVKLLFPAPGVVYPEPFDLRRVREELPREQWPRMRTYTVRRWDAGARELSVDFVVHGDDGLAGPWAARAKAGDELHFVGPGGGYAPDPAADWHLLAGDESALPAIAAALERLPSHAEAYAFVEVAGPEEELELACPERGVIRWLHRGHGQVGEELVSAVRAFAFPAGRPHVFVHGEAGFVKEVRGLLRRERNVPRESLSVSGYWRAGQDEDGWQDSKRQWNRQVEAEQEGTLTESA
ncbi:siderophore-interacting protein [Streptomyces sp. NPDC003247]|uniref:siderophore-interacting protein n=1 Tax=Streptomyces sp. NPDC003247 TaxID=3364677 RepID=UPI0036AD8FCE